MPIPPSAPFPGGAEAAHAERLFALSQDLLGAADAQGYLRWVNAAWERTTGWSPAELYERPYLEFMHPQDRAKVMAFAERLEHMPRGESEEVEARALCRDGSYRWFRCAARSSPTGRSRSSISRRRTSPTCARRSTSSRASGRARCAGPPSSSAPTPSSSASPRSSRTTCASPLTAVSGFLALLESRHGDELPEGAAQLLGYAREGSDRMHALVEDLLAYSRVGHSGRGPERVDAGELVHRIAPTAASGALLEIGELPVVLARPREFEQLLTNLIANAVKFVAEGVKPRVRVERGSPTAAAGASRSPTTGSAWPRPRTTHRIFGMFHARARRRRTYPAPGIGLADLPQKVVEAAGGRIWVEPREGWR